MAVFQQAGFTLLEVLVAMALLVILSGALYGTYFSLMNGREKALAGMESRRELRTTLDMLRREVSGAYFNRTNQGKKKQYFVVEDRDSFGKPASSISFSATAAPGNGSITASDLIEVSYQPVEKENHIILNRQAKDFYQDYKPVAYPQMEDLEGFLVECYDGGKWVRSWDTKLNNALPKAVRITLQIREMGKTAEYSAVASPRFSGP